MDHLQRQWGELVGHAVDVDDVDGSAGLHRLQTLDDQPIAGRELPKTAVGRIPSPLPFASVSPPIFFREMANAVLIRGEGQCIEAGTAARLGASDSCVDRSITIIGPCNRAMVF